MVDFDPRSPPPLTELAMQQEPDCHYDQGTDCLFYSGPAGSRVVEHFLALPRDVRFEVLQSTGIAPDDIKGVEVIWIHNANEMHEEISASQAAFFDWLRSEHS